MCGSREWRGWRLCPTGRDGLLSGVSRPATWAMPTGRAGGCPCPGGSQLHAPPLHPQACWEGCSVECMSPREGILLCSGGFLAPNWGVMGSRGLGGKCQQKFRVGARGVVCPPDNRPAPREMWLLPSEASVSPDPFVSEQMLSVSVADVLGPCALLLRSSLSLFSAEPGTVPGHGGSSGNAE